MRRPATYALSLVFGMTIAAMTLIAQTREMSPAWPYVLPPLPPGAAVPLPGARGQGATAAPGPRARTAGAAPADSNARLVRAAGSKLSFPEEQINDSYGPPDWFPDEHPPMPDVVAHGNSTAAVRACATCHLADGRGKPENAPLQGLPVDAFINQIRDFQQGLRHSADPRKSNTLQMETYAKALTDSDIKNAAAYYAAIKVSKALRVVESDTAPVTKIEGQVYVATEDGAQEPTGTRIVEIAEAPAELAIRNPKTSFVAYVPLGSLSRGRALATTGGNGRTTACTLCHGTDLKGVGPIPNLAGRSPTYLARQLYDIKLGARHGTLVGLMKPIVANLTDGDIVDLTAYLASVDPQ